MDLALTGSPGRDHVYDTVAGPVGTAGFKEDQAIAQAAVAGASSQFVVAAAGPKKSGGESLHLASSGGAA